MENTNNPASTSNKILDRSLFNKESVSKKNIFEKIKTKAKIDNQLGVVQPIIKMGFNIEKMKAFINYQKSIILGKD
jgi:hypothetical protein